MGIPVVDVVQGVVMNAGALWYPFFSTLAVSLLFFRLLYSVSGVGFRSVLVTLLLSLGLVFVAMVLAIAGGFTFYLLAAGFQLGIMGGLYLVVNMREGSDPGSALFSAAVVDVLLVLATLFSSLVSLGHYLEEESLGGAITLGIIVLIGAGIFVAMLIIKVNEYLDVLPSDSENGPSGVLSFSVVTILLGAGLLSGAAVQREAIAHFDWSFLLGLLLPLLVGYAVWRLRERRLRRVGL